MILVPQTRKTTVRTVLGQGDKHTHVCISTSCCREPVLPLLLSLSQIHTRQASSRVSAQGSPSVVISDIVSLFSSETVLIQSLTDTRYLFSHLWHFLTQRPTLQSGQCLKSGRPTGKLGSWSGNLTSKVLSNSFDPISYF